MYLIDTSMWVAFIRGYDEAMPLITAIKDNTPIACTEPVLMEVEAGARSIAAREQDRRLLRRGNWLPFDAASDFTGAAEIYRSARLRGVTPNSHVDCMIIAVALRRRATLMTLDHQQADIARMFGVKVAA